MPRISQLPSLTTADNADEIAIVDVSASTTKKIARGDLLKAPLPTNSVTTAAIADGAVTTTKIANGSVTNSKLSTTTGELGGAWQSWTPTLTNFTGTVNDAKYKLIGKTCYFYIEVTQGSTVTGRHVFTLPVAASASIPTIGWGTPIARGVIHDAGAEVFDAFGGLTSTTTCSLGFLVVSNAKIVHGATSATTPMTWSSGADKFWLQGMYEAA